MANFTMACRKFLCDASSCNAMRFFAKAFSCLMFFFFTFHYNGIAQGARSSCNISGPLVAVASGPDITIQVAVAQSTANPGLNYTFSTNTSGAFIRSYGAIAYNAGTNTATQTLTVNPGATGSGFNLNLAVTTAGGSSQCSTSVSVSQ